MDETKPKNASLEAIKEVGRYLLFSLLAVLVDVALVWVATFTPIPSIPAEIQLLVVAFVAGFLRALDKYIHENEKIDSKGIAPF